MALQRRCPDAGLLHHSDRGSTYASEDYQRMLDAHGITCSMGRTATAMTNVGDGGVLLDGENGAADRFERCDEVKMALFDYIEVFYAPAPLDHRIRKVQRCLNVTRWGRVRRRVAPKPRVRRGPAVRVG